MPFHFLLLLSLAAVIGGCASGQGAAPRGGPPDTTAPEIIGTNPTDGTINFAGESVTVEFSEYLNEGAAAQNVVITPIPATPPEFDWSGRELEITFRQPLLPNRTYAVTFGAGLTDLSNNRLGRGRTLRFATGPNLDSGTIRGTVAGVAKRRAVVFAWLVPPGNSRFLDTLRPDSVRPDFVAPISDDGLFSLEGLPAGTFRLLAVADEFGDQLLDFGNDAFGVFDRQATIPQNYTQPVTGFHARLRPAPLDQKPPNLYSVRSIANTRTELRFSEPIDTATLRPKNFTITAGGGVGISPGSVWQTAESRLIVQLHHAPLLADTGATLAVRSLADTAGNQLPDSSGLQRFAVTALPDTLPPTLLPLDVDTTRSYAVSDSIRLRWSKAVTVAQPDELATIRDTAGRVARFRVVQVSPVELHAFPIDTLAGVGRAMLQLQLGRISDLSGNRTDTTLHFPVRLVPARLRGTMQGNLTDTAAPTIAHSILVTSVATGVVWQLRGVRAGAWEMKGLPEGEYRVAAFRDANGNGKYDQGEIAPWTGPEPWTEFSGTVRVRPRWTVNEVNLVITE